MSQALFPSQLRFIRKARRNLPKIELVQAHYPSHFHPERKPSQVPKDTNKQTHTHTHKRPTAQRQLDREVCVSKSAAMFQKNREQFSRLFEGQMGQWSTYKMVNGFRTCRTEDGVEREASTILRWRIGRMGWCQSRSYSLRRRRL
jgi:hypothetical protein